MKKILYVMNVEWNWIKQRPHFIAEGLSKNYHVEVLYRYWYNRKGLTLNRNENSVKLSRIYSIPFITRFAKLKAVNDWIVSRKIKKVARKFDPDIVYLTHPNQFERFDNNYKGKVIYDCMDYHTAFITENSEQQRIKELETKLIARADLILVSSEKLRSNLLKDFQEVIDDSKLKVVRNGYNGEILEVPAEKRKGPKYIFAYVGTISHWFDFDILLKSLNEFEDIEYRLIGPVSGVTIPENDRIKYLGSVDHQDIYSNIKDADALIMPFTLNDIVEAVDPVKLYEYINFNKDILTVRYKEIERFSKFTYSYDSYDEYKKQLKLLLQATDIKYDQDSREQFLNANNWENRVSTIEKLIEELR
ncbi:glycosyltransferase [Streptococcus parasanguinis]|jgi:hypothetical protein|uniref:glycosyltransferase n=1 Tax=Streptococcus TaxID=1301 RepID=UPI00066D3E3C|nr:glycosyltransferase [Streptococcus parasanguinis]MCB6704307.1 glycosyltransferase [Streptococcus parasanguinis]MCB6738944.1 glycosyltransferase [Streptococcus parasanguinis]MCB7322399.1 glycosyltransferase [Streptococcus parasanguinis]MCB7402430.1 glycosyltransferase [Streptococcus parasanguinis]